MAQAAAALTTAENASYQGQKAAHRNGYHSPIYPVGSAYAVCQAEAQLMGAIVCVLSESLTGALRGFYKLRKAYITLQGIANAERMFIKGHKPGTRSTPSVNSSRRTLEPLNGARAESTRQQQASNASKDEDEGVDLDFVDADKEVASVTPPPYQGHMDSDDHLSGSGKVSNTSEHATASHDPAEDDDDPALDELTKHPIDLFIHSSLNASFGILQVLHSLVPPTFTKLLNVAGFKGDRDEGLKMLWRATRHADVNGFNGALAGLAILGYYNGMIGSCDIVAESSYPEARLRALLSQMRRLYPQSRLWLLEEARLLAGDKNLEAALEVGDPRKNKSPLKQVEASLWFERSLNCMYLHRYQDCADSFLECIKLGNWSHGLYYYIAGVCHVELYRQYKTSDPAKAAIHAAEATEMLREVPLHTGKKRLMAKPLPLDTFVSRKIQKWEARSTEHDIDFIDAVGVSPVDEMTYFWNGYKRMRPSQLEQSLECLNRCKTHLRADETADERAILAFLTSVTLSRLGRMEEAKTILRTELLSHEWFEFRGGLKDDWTLPVAHYEMAVMIWEECHGERGTHAEMQECSNWLDKAAKWESYQMDTP